MKLTSSTFEDGTTIPQEYGYNYGNKSPPLKIENIPKNTKSLVLIMDDPDAERAVGKIWVHWVLWNITPETELIPENSIPKYSTQGKNDFQELGYGGPSPPDREHTYFFKLYALSNILDLNEGSSKQDVENYLKDNILEQCVLRGKFSPQLN